MHLTDHTLATGTGVLRVEDLGPLLAGQLSELVGHGPYVVKPVIDLNDAVSVDAYEIPDRIRERVKLIHPVELFPYGTRETHAAMDLDHIEPYDPLGPPGQTTPANLAPLRRFPHRVKTHGRWTVRRLDPKTLEWTTPNGFAFHVDPTGTHRAPNRNRTHERSRCARQHVGDVELAVQSECAERGRRGGPAEPVGDVVPGNGFGSRSRPRRLTRARLHPRGAWTRRSNLRRTA